MIRVVMLGRLGNNLFQYAFGRVLAEKHQVPLVLDGSWFNHRTWPYVEQIRQLPGIEQGKARVVRPFSLGSRVLRRLSRMHHWELLPKPVVSEQEGDHSYDSALLDAPADCVVFGYFQTPRYFMGMEETLRRELDTGDLGLDVGFEPLAERLKNPSSVAVHVRRTDYVGNPNLMSLNRGYYECAMQRMKECVPDARFHVFSDDPAWCLKAFSSPDIEVVTHCDPLAPLRDLHLMSLAGHHIMANSSYSWWAAWLGQKPGQKVLMPSVWFRGGINAPVSEKQLPGWEIVPIR